ncbi:MAG: hypothetical protein BAA04_07545 [Firmicutes bacterium ZCTH02-B6]|nr:MAG: hypothetical protein BAA04_07545 [Firmicutes bacterium ZCTH02-B6]
MILLPEAEVLQALKKCKRLAKQDLLASAHTSNPDFWRSQAEARRAMYDRLMALVESEGVEAAYRTAVDEHAALPLVDSPEYSPEVSGKRQALEMFFTILGVQQPAAGEDSQPMVAEATS